MHILNNTLKWLKFNTHDGLHFFKKIHVVKHLKWLKYNVSHIHN
jgi:hypothetical protein